jgi:hypothetical protein
MRIPQTFLMASALVLAAGCAREQQHAQYDESLSPAYSAGRTSQSGDEGNNAAAQGGLNGATERTGSQSDNAIVSSVRESLRRNAEIAPMVSNIQITANNGAVMLSGTVQSDEQKRQIGDIAQQSTGVVAVNNQLQVMAIPAANGVGAENQGSNPLLNPTSNGGENAPKLYQDAGNGAGNSSSNALDQTSRTNGPGRIYHENNQQLNGPGPASDQNTNTTRSP